MYFLSQINAPAKRFGHTLTSQRIDSFFLSRTIFLALFGSHDMSESMRLAAKKDLSLVLSYGHSTWKIFTEERATTSYKLENQHTNRWHQK